MSERRPTAASLTRQAIERIQEDEIADARLILAEALDLDPAYEPAWLWFAHIAEDAGERRFALEQAAAANPESNALQELPSYRRVTPVEPPEVSDLVPPPPPPTAPGRRAVVRERISAASRRKLIGAVLGGIALLAVVIGLVLVLVDRREDPIFIAIAGSMTDPSGREVVNSARLYFDAINADGGIAGRPVEFLIHEDQNTEQGAIEVANEIVADGRALLVIGHTVSTASAAAGPIYAAAGIPAITSTSTADDVTEDNPWYFRTVFDNHTQGFLIAAYARYVLGADQIVVLSGDDDYGQSLAAGVAEAFTHEGEQSVTIEIALGEDERPASIAAAIAALQAQPEADLLVIALQAGASREMVTAARDAGLTVPMLGGDAIGSNRFLEAFADLPAEMADPGFYTDGIYAASPLIMDSLTSDSVRWFEAYREAFEQEPTWRGATTYDAAIAAATAMHAADLAATPGDDSADRQRIRDALAALDSPDTAVAGLLGPIYFDETNTTPRAAAFGVARDARYASAFEQLRPYRPSASHGLEEDLASGVAIDVDGQILERRRIVFAGINMNEIGELDTTNPSFFADFFLWFNYTGDDSATDIEFLNAVDPELELGAPVRQDDDDGTKYRLYHVSGRFKAPLEFQDFPFDEQHLLISFQNRTLPSSKIVYAVDRDFLSRPAAERLQSGANAAVSINAIPSWQATDMIAYQGTIGSTALMGDPEANVGSAGIEYSLFTADVTITRELAAFLVKNLLPLVLLAAITYVSLFFPHSQTGERVAFAVSAILTTAVLLTSVTGALPQVGYTVAIEWGFYAFIFLSATCIIIGLVGDWLYEARRYSELRRLDRFSRVYYPAFVLVVVLAYVVRYGGA